MRTLVIPALSKLNLADFTAEGTISTPITFFAPFESAAVIVPAPQ